MSAMVIKDGKLGQLKIKKKVFTTISVYFEFAVMKTGSKVLSIGEG